MHKIVKDTNLTGVKSVVRGALSGNAALLLYFSFYCIFYAFNMFSSYRPNKKKARLIFRVECVRIKLRWVRSTRVRLRWTSQQKSHLFESNVLKIKLRWVRSRWVRLRWTSQQKSHLRLVTSCKSETPITRGSLFFPLVFVFFQGFRIFVFPWRYFCRDLFTPL